MRTSSTPTIRVTKSLGRSRISCGVQPSKPLQRTGHRAGERLHFRTERHTDMSFAGFIDMQINANSVHAFLVFADIDKIKIFTLARLLFLRVVRVGDERLAPLIFWQRFEEIYDLVELDRIRSVGTDFGGTRLI